MISFSLLLFRYMRWNNTNSWLNPKAQLNVAYSKNLFRILLNELVCRCEN